MSVEFTNKDQTLYDPRGVVEAEQAPLAARVAALEGLRLGVLDNSKWNAGKLLGRVTARLDEECGFTTVNRYCKETFSRSATEAMISEIIAKNDVVVTAIGD